MRAGTLRHSISYKTVSTVTDSQGGRQTNLTTVLNTRAAIKSIKATDVTSDSQQQYEETITFHVRYQATYATTGYITYNGKDYQIVSLTPDSTGKRELTIVATYRQPARKK